MMIKGNNNTETASKLLLEILLIHNQFSIYSMNIISKECGLYKNQKRNELQLT